MGRISPDVMGGIVSTSDIEKLTDIICGSLFIDYDEKQYLLELLDPKKRVSELIKILTAEIDLLQLEIDIQAKVKSQIDKNQKDKQNLATFIGYKGKGFSLGAEYNLYMNDKNQEGADLYGLSIYGSASLNKKTELYARYDNLSSKDDWNEAKDQSGIIAGLQFKLGKYMKIAPNFRMNIPKAEGADNKYMGYISCYFGL